MTWLAFYAGATLGVAVGLVVGLALAAVAAVAGVYLVGRQAMRHERAQREAEAEVPSRQHAEAMARALASPLSGLGVH